MGRVPADNLGGGLAGFAKVEIVPPLPLFTLVPKASPVSPATARLLVKIPPACAVAASISAGKNAVKFLFTNCFFKQTLRYQGEMLASKCVFQSRPEVKICWIPPQACRCGYLGGMFKTSPGWITLLASFKRPGFAAMIFGNRLPLPRKS